MPRQPHQRIHSVLLLAWTVLVCSQFPIGTTVVAAETLAPRNGVAILKDALPGADSATADAVAETLRCEGFEITWLSADEVCDPAKLSPERFFLYVVPNLRSYPVAGENALLGYLQAKGNLLVLGETPFDKPAWKHNDQWVDEVLVRESVAKDPSSHLASAKAPRSHLPPIETVAPGYKFYPLTKIASLKVVESQGILSTGEDFEQHGRTVASACYARPEGKGFECGYRWRWIPLIRAYDSDGVDRGAVVWLTLNQASRQFLPEGFEDAARRLRGDNRGDRQGLHQTPPLEGSVCAVCSVSDPATLQQMARSGVFDAMVRRIRDGLFLSYAGSQHFSCWPGEKVKLGAVAINHGSQRAEVRVRIRVCPGMSQTPVFQKETAIELDAGQYRKQTFGWTPTRFDADRYIVTTELLRDGVPIDVIEHELGVLSTEEPSRDDFVRVEGDNFRLRGKKWYPVGANYWPQYAIGLEPDDYTYHWLAPGFYNPEEVERDLRRLKSLGANFLLVRAGTQHEGRNLLDFLRRCKNHDIYVMLFLYSHVITDEPHYFQGVMMPFHFQEDVVATFLRETRLADNPTIMGYDLIWEPSGWVFAGRVGMFNWPDPTPYRQRWDSYWHTWIVDRYGSVANAETDWGVPAPRIGDRVTSPSYQQFSNDGPWRVMVAAYRRFMDDLMSRFWNDAVQRLRRLDPNHLVSFRQGNLGAMDFTLTATPKYVDFFSMEGYSFKANESGAAAAGFTTRYLHFLTKKKPIIWVEYGSSAWDRAAMKPGEKQMAAQAKTIEMIHREAFANGANGIAPWWWPGGYRISEQSDYGLINPDGTARPSTEVLRKYAILFQTPRAYPAPQTWFTMDRDSHAGSHWYITFNEGAEAYKKAIAAGKKLGVRTSGTGTTSADTPLLAVGNTQYNGKNPPKYLDAEFNWFKIKIGDGPWVDVRNGEKLCVPKDTPITAAASVGNLQEAIWLTPASAADKPGAVYLVSTAASTLEVKRPIVEDTAWQEDAEFGNGFLLSEGVSEETPVELHMMAAGRARFGEKLRFVLIPSTL